MVGIGGAFLNKVGYETLVALSPDYELHDRLKEVVMDTKARIAELLNLEPDLSSQAIAVRRFLKFHC